MRTSFGSSAPLGHVLRAFTLASAIACSAESGAGGAEAGQAPAEAVGGAAPSGGGGGASSGGAAPGAGGTDSYSGGQPGATSGGAPASGGASGSGGTASGGDAGGAQNAGTGGSVEPSGTIDCRVAGDGRTTLVIVNRCAQTLTYAGSEGVSGSLVPGGHACIEVGTDVEPLSAKRYWGFLGEDPGPERHTLAEFTFNTDFYDFDWYNISHVDAHNLPMQISPAGRADCPNLTCAESLLAGCPEVGQYYGSDGSLLSCVSPERDDPESPVALWFEQCDDGYAWSGDDQQGEDPSPMRGVCAGEDYDVVFCPAP